MNYAQTIEYLYSQLPMFTRIGAAAYKEDLNNTFALAALLDQPQDKFKSIHVAGTNGKGSVSHMLAAVFQEAGYKTGLYTSPHLKDFRERIRINGHPCREDFVISFVERMQQGIKDIEPSFFELTMMMAFEYFATEQVDIAIIETGLGGRLDSTNIITPELSVITNISFDHMHILGDTLPKIAFEKAGIIKPNVPVVIGETQEEVKHVFVETAERKASPIYFADQQWRITDRQPELENLTLTILQDADPVAHNFTLDLTGHYQEKNLLSVLTATNILREQGWQISDEQLHSALSKVKLLTGIRGRWDVINRAPYTVLDVGHNEAGIREILQQLTLVNYKQLHIVTGFVKDKDVSKALELLPGFAQYYFTKAQIPRAMEEHELYELAVKAGLSGQTYPTVAEAFHAAREAADKEDMILVCGSFFIVAEVM
ncbi:bifunctional folylpolyglutamate synthase/dihydrofolate synthase [Chitinophaga sedimenti]|uniref:bifunctional folylpolyglutamate synthase/dihydrofolate synthase n=1 Tax=Chitinophaga sedimenti TaxID=2033606 RepID=UPI0020044150|nr:folylpolyglutamate synthase/dihydrofolate synthase family protein [Chitinophaga sedimenti]MCK7554561.1 bifunctional folylpolyglutamate synthase/dihydrofolate synthase [Chitinophaga sedimenti]